MLSLIQTNPDRTAEPMWNWSDGPNCAIDELFWSHQQQESKWHQNPITQPGGDISFSVDHIQWWGGMFLFQTYCQVSFAFGKWKHQIDLFHDAMKSGEKPLLKKVRKSSCNSRQKEETLNQLLHELAMSISLSPSLFILILNEHAICNRKVRHCQKNGGVKIQFAVI